MKQANLIEARQITKIFPMGEAPVKALNNVDLDISRGEFTGIVGPSGSGKTTLLNIMGALDIPTSGSMLVLGHQIETLSHKAASNLRNEHLGFIFQSFNLLPVYTVYENVEFPLLLQKMPSAERRKAVLQSLEWMHLTDKIKAKPAQLSGGQSQRVAIARAMVKNPELVLADEPTANLDAENSHHILRLMKKLNEELNTTFLFSTHDEKVVQYLSRIITLKDGSIFSDEAKEPQLTAQSEMIQE